MYKPRVFSVWSGWCVGLLFAISVSHESNGQQVGNDPPVPPAVIHGTCQANDIERLIEAAMLDEAQAEACRDAFAVYLVALDELRQVGGAELVDAGFLQQRALRSVLMPEDRAAILFPGLEMDGPVRAPPDDPRWVTLREISAAVHNTRRDIRRRHHDLLITLFASLQAVLDDAGHFLFTARQFILLELADAGADVALRNQKFMHVDVASLARESMIEGVLGDVCARFAARQEGRLDEAAFRVQIADILREYYVRLEPLLTKQQFELGEIMKPSEVLFSHTPTETEMDTTLKRSGRRWSGRHDIDSQAARQIDFVVAQTAGDPHVARWRRSFEQAVAPHIFVRRPSHEIADWFDEQSGTNVDQRAAARALQNEHDRRYELAAMRAYRAGLALTRDHGSVLIAGTDTQAHERYMLALLRLIEISMEFVEQVQPLLSEAQAAAFREWLPRDPRRFGPSIRKRFLPDDDVQRLLRIYTALKQ